MHSNTSTTDEPSDARIPPWSVPVGDLIVDLGSDAERGITNAEAARRLARDGPNELAASAHPGLLRRFVAQFNDPLVGLLLAAIVVSFLAWWSDGADTVPIETIVIAVIVVANACIGVWQEGRAFDAVAALRRLTALHATVVREGRVITIPTAGLVVGDIVTLAEGDAVSADCRVIECASLEVSEAALTGESLPIAKETSVLAPEVAVADRVNTVFSGTAVTKGRGRCIVTATGTATETGRIAELLDSSASEPTPLQRQIDQLSRWLGVAVVGLALVVVAAIFMTSDISSSADALEALLVAVSLAVAAVPEGLPAILTVVLALGVQRMADSRAIVKRLLSVETLGAASIICTDKTGTLTRNEMTVVRIAVAGGLVDVTGVGYAIDGEVVHRRGRDETTDRSRIDDDVWQVLRGAAMSNDAVLDEASDGSPAVAGDPTEVALLVAARKHALARAQNDAGNGDAENAMVERVGEIPFESERKLMTTLHVDGPDGPWLQYTKGAPDVLLGACSHELVEGERVALTTARRARVRSVVNDFADDGLRTLAVARRIHVDAPTMDSTAERDLTLLGIVGIADPAKTEVLPVISEAERAGVRTVMVTGDHPRTARAIGRSLGMRLGPSSVVTGQELAAALDRGGSVELDAVVRDAAVFARVTPEDKLRIVESYQRCGRIVAMTGDGVNDAPALRQADIGVAMGRGGTEVARDAADMILADDDFGTIVRAIREGREIFADIRKFLRYLLASNCGEVLVMIIGVLAAAPLGLAAAGEGLAVPLLATQILWINLLTDSSLALALGVDPSVDDVMSAPPRRLDEPIIDRQMWITIALIGVVTAIAGLVALDLELAGGPLGGSGDLTTARTMLFTTLVLAQIFNAFNTRSDEVSAFVSPFSNRLLWAAAALTVAMQIAVVHAAPFNRAFETTPLDVGRWTTCVLLASTVLVVSEIRKFVMKQPAAPVPLAAHGKDR